MIKGAVKLVFNRPLFNRKHPLSRPFNSEPIKKFKVCVPASLAARVELSLWDRINKKPRYGARGKVIEELLELWVEGKIPSISVQPTPPIE